MALVATAELGLTAFLISAGNEVATWSTPGYHSLLILLCFEAAWTLVFSTAYMIWVVEGAVRMLASIATSVFWLLLTAVVWGTGAGLIHSNRVSGTCFDRSTLSRFVPTSMHIHPHELRSLGDRCGQSVTVEALGWTEFSLSCVTLIATVMWMKIGFGRKRLRGFTFIHDSRTFV